MHSNINLDFSDVLIIFTFKHTGKSWTGIPIGVSNMAKFLSEYNCFSCLNKHISYEQIPHDLDNNFFSISTGISKQLSLFLFA